MQDERALDAYLCLAERQKIAHSHALQKEHEQHILGNLKESYYSNFPTQWVKDCLDRYHGSDAVFCAHTSFFDEVSEWIREATTNGVYFYYLFEFLQTHYMQRHGIDEYVDPVWYAHAHHYEHPNGYRPFYYKDDSNVLYSNHYPRQPIGIVRPISYTGFADFIDVIEPETQSKIGVLRHSTRFRLR